MDPAQAALASGLGVGILSYVVNPWIQAKLRNQRDNDPALGWRKAVKNLEDRVGALEEENVKLEGELADVKSQLSDKSATIRRQEKVIADQTRMLDARDRYLSRLRGIWGERIKHEEFPAPLPSYAYWLYYTPGGTE